MRQTSGNTVERGQRLSSVLPALLTLLIVVSAGARSAMATNTVQQLVRNGGLETPDPHDPAKPRFWDKPDELGVQWTNAPADTGENAAGTARGKAIRMNTAISEIDMVKQWSKMGITKWDVPNAEAGAIAATYGLSFYSEAFPIEKGQPYKVSFDYRGPSGGAKVWVRGYGMYRGEVRRRYETIVNCRGPNGQWNHFSQAFFPTKSRPGVTELKVMLYAYWPPGVYWFDNIEIEPVTVAEYEDDKYEHVDPKDRPPPAPAP